MRQITKILLPLALALLVAAPLSAADTKTSSYANRLVTSQLKKLQKADLTTEQVAKVKELVAKFAEKAAPLYKKSAYTPEQKKAYAEAIKKAKAEGKTGKELSAAYKSAVKLTAVQTAARKQVQDAYSAMMKEIVGMLTDEQKAKVPKKSSRSKKTG